MLLSLLIERPVLLPRWWNLMTQPHNGKPHPLRHQIHLAVWPVSGESSRVKAFQKTLARSSSNPGLQELKNNKPWREWTSWCDRRACHLFQAPVNLFIDFLLEVYKLGRSYSTVNTYRSAISATIHSVTGRDLGSNHLVSRFMKGNYVAKPPLPRYTATWDVSKVTDYLRTLVPLESLSFKDLSKKLVMLLALSSRPEGTNITSPQH